jgi:tetratricopeptide (TPR) repeat protein
MADLFISYRRGDSPYALLLYDRLGASFGRDRVFRDIEGIAPGRYFDDVITAELRECRAVVAVIGPQWVAALDRLQDSEDWVRREIALSLDEKKPLFPALVGGTAMPARNALPADVAPLTGLNAVTLSDLAFHRDVDGLLGALEPIVPAAAGGAAAQAPDARRKQAARLLCAQAERLQVRAVELIEEGKPDRAVDELAAGHDLLMLLMDWAPEEVDLDLHLGYFYKTFGQAFTKSDPQRASNYLDLAASMFERVRARPAAGSVDPIALAGAINGLGNVYAERNQPDRALDMYRAATALAPTYAYAWHDIFAALDQKARAGQVDVTAMREALDNARRTGTGLPGLSASHLDELEARLAWWAQADARPARGTNTQRAVPAKKKNRRSPR